ncbi:hypothetical protein [Acetonema longum]|uniref:Uncharacterized protein n=1 Tax=Acetonema longum DSM 6540 TaxID=1009370 RepID=F7NHY4_9FIRM|nr:hypothetical protein [Acetonema longum]EGO64363.1 hypothetical protein ALO_08410 [Acetonema longum DSM 6540]
MKYFIFIAAGIVSGFHVYTYGRWLKQQGNTAGAIMTFVLAAAAMILPVYAAVKR